MFGYIHTFCALFKLKVFYNLKLKQMIIKCEPLIFVSRFSYLELNLSIFLIIISHEMLTIRVIIWLVTFRAEEATSHNH